MATHRGYDSDHPRVTGDVGKAGVAIYLRIEEKIIRQGRYSMKEQIKKIMDELNEKIGEHLEMVEDPKQMIIDHLCLMVISERNNADTYKKIRMRQ